LTDIFLLMPSSPLPDNEVYNGLYDYKTRGCERRVSESMLGYRNQRFPVPDSRLYPIVDFATVRRSVRLAILGMRFTPRSTWSI